jgi:hypothetical protein
MRSMVQVEPTWQCIRNGELIGKEKKPEEVYRRPFHRFFQVLPSQHQKYQRHHKKRLHLLELHEANLAQLGEAVSLALVKRIHLQ